jgi:hypothetical protein
MKLSIGQKVFHEKYGLGTVIDAWTGRKSSENYAVKFDKGGPQGFAEGSTHEPAELKAV